jgi:hypothetical protein
MDDGIQAYMLMIMAIITCTGALPDKQNKQSKHRGRGPAFVQLHEHSIDSPVFRLLYLSLLFDFNPIRPFGAIFSQFTKW